MRVQTDDDVYAVDNHWLGPPGRSFAWRARYSAYGVFLAVMLLMLAIERRAGIGLSFWSFTDALLIAVAATRALMRLVNHERPVRTLGVVFAHEISGPRRRQKSSGAVLRPQVVPIRTRSAIVEIARTRQAAIAARRSQTA